MTCTSPFKLQGKEGKVYLLPCGYCMSCRVARNREWAARLLHEKTNHKHSAFLTLTFAPENIPPLDSIQKDTLQKFLKRLRKSLEPRKIRYFGCGEYGELHGHAHYHLIVFGLSLSDTDKQLVKAAWPFGFVYFGTVSYSSCRYVTAYILKKVTGQMAAAEYGDRVPPFALMSKGLGKDFFLKNLDQFNQLQGMTVDGHHVSLPKYYKNLTRLVDTWDGPSIRPVMDLDKQAIVDKAIEKAHEKLEQYRERGLIDEDNLSYSIDKARESEDKQRALNLQAKLATRSHKKL